MALARCKTHGKPEGRTHRYVRAPKPVGYPSTALVCGVEGCENPAMVWLTEEEAAAYETGTQVFAFPFRRGEGQS